MSGAMRCMNYLSTPTRRSFLVALLLSVSGLAAALVLQYHYGMHPCPLCVTQRIALCALAVFSLAGALAPLRVATTVSVVARVCAAGGLGVAGWHTAHVLFPPREQSCAPGLGYWLDHLWIADRMPWMFSPSGDCLRDAASFLELPLPAYALALFLLIFMTLRTAVTPRRQVVVPHQHARTGPRA